uniref:Uncharacterized protein n=1 Tax=viral metagenome TaxID=1070528 RepID=A0A6M3LUQ7_9ZZZZ
MKISELKKLIENIPDDFEFEIEVQKDVPQKELKKRSWAYPLDTERCQTNVKDYDIGWSDKKVKLDVKINEL